MNDGTGPYYSSGIIGTGLLNAAGIQNFIDDVRGALENSKWSFVSQVSGASGTKGYVLISKTPPEGAPMRTKFWWDGSSFGGTPLIRFQAQDNVGVHTAEAGQIAIEPNKKSRIICGPFQYWILFDASQSPGPTSFGTSFNDVGMGVPVMNNGSSTWWALGGRNSFRHTLVPPLFDGHYGYMVDGIFRNTIDSTYIYPQLLVPRGTSLLQPIPFSDDFYPVSQALLMMGTTTAVKVYKLWDAFVLGKPETLKITTFADFHDWEGITITTEPLREAGCLFLATGSLGNLRVGSYSH